MHERWLWIQLVSPSAFFLVTVKFLSTPLPTFNHVNVYWNLLKSKGKFTLLFQKDPGDRRFLKDGSPAWNPPMKTEIQLLSQASVIFLNLWNFSPERYLRIGICNNYWSICITLCCKRQILTMQIQTSIPVVLNQTEKVELIKNFEKKGVHFNQDYLSS